jgi:hypothetical protein
MPVTSYELGVSGTSFTGAANREDLLDIITILSPVDTPLFTMLRKTKVSNVQTEWLVDALDQATSNATAEGSQAIFAQSVRARTRLKNYTQISREEYDVSDTQRAVNPAGIRDEFRYQMGKALKQWKRDVEHDIVNGNTASAASTRCAMGLFRWIDGFSSLTASALDANTASNLQEADLNSRLQAVWVAGGLCDYVLCTPTQKSHISNNFAGSANSRRNIPLTENTLVNVVDFYMSDFGNVKILPHRWFNSAAVGPVNNQKRTAVIQSDKWLIGFLRPPKNIPLAKVGSSERAMVEGEWTLICLHPSANSFACAHAAGTFSDNFPGN